MEAATQKLDIDVEEKEKKVDTNVVIASLEEERELLEVPQ